MAGWANTLLAQRSWTTRPALADILGYPCPEELLQPDPFHLIKFAIGRSVAGGVLTYLARKGFFDFEGCESRSFTERLNRGHGHFSLWCRAQKQHPALRSFSKQFLNMKSFQSAPWSNTKGSDTRLLLRWLSFYISLILKAPEPGTDCVMLRRMHQLCQAYRAIFRSIHGHNLWMDRVCARRLYVDLMRFLRGDQLLGSLCLQRRLRAFLLKPKNHSLAHLALHIREQLAMGAPFILNIECYSCGQDEDFIGRVSRLSRKVSVRTQGKRIFQRIFLKFSALRRRKAESKAKAR